MIKLHFITVKNGINPIFIIFNYYVLYKYQILIISITLKRADELFIYHSLFLCNYRTKIKTDSTG